MMKIGCSAAAVMWLYFKLIILRNSVDILVTSISFYIGTMIHCHYDSLHAGTQMGNDTQI